MTGDVVSILQNDPNQGLRIRLHPDRTSHASAQETLTQALADLQAMARDRAAAPEAGRGRHGTK